MSDVADNGERQGGLGEARPNALATHCQSEDAQKPEKIGGRPLTGFVKLEDYPEDLRARNTRR